MGVRMNQQEVEAFLAAAHTGVLSTLRADGRPVAVPMWFVLDRGQVVMRTLAATKKAANVGRDPRVSFLVESGRAWAELRAVLLQGTVAAEPDPEAVDRIDAAFAAKYAGFLMPETTPAASRGHYDAPRLHLRLTPTEPPRSWDNSKLFAAPVG